MDEDNKGEGIFVKTKKKFIEGTKSILSQKKSVKLLFLAILAAIIMILMIIFTILGFLVWSTGLGAVNFLFIALGSALVLIITTNMWKREKKRERNFELNY